MTKPADEPSGEPLALRCNDVLAVVDDTKKLCRKCGTEQDRSEFYPRPGMRDGLMAHCKTCHRAMTKAWSERNAAKHKALREAWTATHKDRVNETRRARAADVRNAAGPSYAAKVLGVRVSQLPQELAAVKQDQLIIRRLARQLKKATHESSEDSR